MVDARRECAAKTLTDGLQDMRDPMIRCEARGRDDYSCDEPMRGLFANSRSQAMEGGSFDRPYGCATLAERPMQPRYSDLAQSPTGFPSRDSFDPGPSNMASANRPKAILLLRVVSTDKFAVIQILE